MREIKFRAWDKGLEFMRFFKLHEIHGPAIPQDWKIMEYTGLIDKKGKEIYEGDIMYLDFKSKVIGQGKGEVRFQDGTFGLELTGGFWPFLANNDAKIYEVLGNIYENKDLISE
jgi:uncharacterized phage protein (TIGR01671 family)